MRNQLLNAIKVIALAIILSFGLSYAIAWTAPATTPPGGNVDAPINTGSTAQAKAGNLTVNSLDLNTGNITNAWNIVANSVSAGTVTLTGTATVNDVYITSIGKYASELYPVPLVGGLHTVSQCSSLGGSSVDIGGGNKVCKLAGASCPVGWTKYGNWSTTSNTNVSYVVKSGTRGNCRTYTATCSSFSHTWADTAQESVSCYTHYNDWCGGTNSTITATATITETGCY